MKEIFTLSAMHNTEHNQVTLTFPDLGLLWSFAQTLGAKSIEISRVDIALICACTEADITRAVTHYQAKLEKDPQTYGTRHTQIA